MRWSEDDTQKFVKLYLSRQYLWNPEDPGYKLKTKRLEGYKDIIEEFLSISGILLNDLELKTKIKNLRSTYYQELRKINQRSRPGIVYSSTIKWFADWHDHFKLLNRKMHYEPSMVPTQELDDDSCQKIWISHEENDAEVDPFIPHSDDDYLLVLKSEKPESSEDTDLSPYKAKKRKFKLCTTNGKHLDYVSNSIDSCSHSREDEYDIYGKYIASQLRKLDVRKAIRVQLEIQTIVSEARLSSMRSSETDRDIGGS